MVGIIEITTEDYRNFVDAKVRNDILKAETIEKSGCKASYDRRFEVEEIAHILGFDIPKIGDLDD